MPGNDKKKGDLMIKINSLEALAVTYTKEILKPYDELYRAAGLKALLFLCQEFGGTTVYIPRKETVFKNCIAKAIREEYDGTNLRELAHKYGYTASTVKKILKKRKVSAKSAKEAASGKKEALSMSAF